MTGTTDRLLTQEEVAALFGVAAVTVRKWARTGRLTRHGGWRPRYSESEVRALLGSAK